MRQKPSDRDILRSIPLLYGHDDLESLRDAIIQVVAELFDVDLVSYSRFIPPIGNEINSGNDESANRVVHGQPGTNMVFHDWSDESANCVAQRLSPVFGHVIDTHPLAPYGDVSPVAPSKRVSDVLGNSKFRETAFYREYYRHYGVKYQMVIPLEITSTFHSGVTLDKSVSDFTDCDLELANLIRPHMYQAFRLVLLQERQRSVLTKQAALLDERGLGQIDVAFDGWILDETPAARQALLQSFPGGQTTGSVIPSAIHEWLLSRLDFRLDAKPDDQEPSLRLMDADGELCITILSVQYELQRASLLVSYSERFDPFKRLHRDGLTRREAEVLYRLTRGETDKQIARALGIRPATARTHVERIRRKLDVETRTAAATIAQVWLRERI